MTEKISLDTGLLELEINDNGVLRFNASDFNVYQRFLALVKELPELEKEYAASVERTGDSELELAGATLNQAREVDRKVKGKLSEVFGLENDFDHLLGGVNIMAFGNNGERVIANLLNALKPFMENGIKRHMEDAAKEAVAEAKQNRAQRRVKK